MIDLFAQLLFLLLQDSLIKLCTCEIITSLLSGMINVLVVLLDV